MLFVLLLRAPANSVSEPFASQFIVAPF